MGDAYAGGRTNNVQRQCWDRGYVSVTHGGGASMVAQTNDTELHKPVRQEFCELQQEALLEKTRSRGGGLIETTDEECITLMAQVMSNPKHHLQACRGYKSTGTTLAFDASEDDLIENDAKDFWFRLGVREKVDRHVASLERGVLDGKLEWGFQTVQKEIIPYPTNGHHDTLEFGMEDEATDDPDGCVWEGDSNVSAEEDEANSQCHGEPEAFDAGDWVDPESAKERYGDALEEVPHHCHGAHNTLVKSTGNMEPYFWNRNHDQTCT